MIISRIGRKHWKPRLLIGSIYLVLLIGSLSMIYPFGLMVAGSTKSGVDVAEMRLVPAFLRNDAALYRKHVEGLFNESLEMYRVCYDQDASTFSSVPLPAPGNTAFVDCYRDFLATRDLPTHSFELGYLHCPVSRSTFPHVLRRFKRSMLEQFEDIDALNHEMLTDFANWSAFYVLPQTLFSRQRQPNQGRFADAYGRFKAESDLTERFYFNIEGFYKQVFLKSQYTKDIAVYNKAHGTTHPSWADVHLTRHLPEGPGRTTERADWTLFVRSLVSLQWVRVDASATAAYRAFIKAKYRQIEVFNRHYGGDYRRFDDVQLATTAPAEGIQRSDWDAFIQGWKDPDTNIMHIAPVTALLLETVDFRFRDYVKQRFASLPIANRMLGSSFQSWADVRMPQEALHYQDFLTKKWLLRKEFCVRNFVAVSDFILLRGRGVLNTFIYCTLAILGSLIINPLAAYGLSRYRPPSTYKFLLILMLTMAFPPMVTQIPVFLMLRQFHMLNTFWALILPGLANGYAIFLLKGFFDSLPRELYESAELDGAGEFRIFWQITMSLSKPILAVIALNAFTLAYSNFMMALLICQDQKMWTLMPWLYQLQQRSGQGVIMASLLIAAGPTFLVFAFCQNVIMRGIVVPVEK